MVQHDRCTSSEILIHLMIIDTKRLSFQLAISPQPRSQNEPVTVQNDTGLTLKVEGVVQHGGRTGLFRSMHRVIVNVASSQTSRAQTVSADAKVSAFGCMSLKGQINILS